MSLTVVRYRDGRRVAVPETPAPSRPRGFVVVEDRRGRLGVVDAAGELVANTSGPRSAFALAELLNVLAPDASQLAALLGEGRRGAPLLRTITLAHASICHRCGQTLKPGQRARWNAHTKLTRHLRACPRDVITGARRRKRVA